MPQRIPVAVLAATGSVGQRFVQLLKGHPWFEVVAVTGSDRTIGQKYGTGCHWLLPEPMPEQVTDLEVLPTTPEAVQVPLVFSALPANIAREAEPLFAKSGIFVCSNASAFRREPDVPILYPSQRRANRRIEVAAAESRLERRHRHQFQLHQHRRHRDAQSAAAGLWP